MNSREHRRDRVSEVLLLCDVCDVFIFSLGWRSGENAEIKKLGNKQMKIKSKIEKKCGNREIQNNKKISK